MTGEVKPRKWGKRDGDLLADPIEDRTVDIEKPEHLTPAYINRVRADKFCHFGVKNFRTNYRNYLRQHSLAEEYDGAHKGCGKY